LFLLIIIKREALRYYLDCSVTLCPGGQSEWTLSELHNPLSVTALQWRSSGTTSRVFIWRRAQHIR